MGLPSSSNQSQGQTTFTMLSTLTGSGSLSGSTGTNSLGIGIPTSSMVGSATGQAGIGNSTLSGMAPGSVGSPGSGVNGPGRIGVNPNLGMERRTADMLSAFSDSAQAVSKVTINFQVLLFKLLLVLCCNAYPTFDYRT